MNLPNLTDVCTTPMLLEAAMLVCFGIAWPLANLRMLRTWQVTGQSRVFPAVILSGYLLGAAAKWLAAGHGTPLVPVFWLYVLNAGSVSMNLALQWFIGRRVGRI